LIRETVLAARDFDPGCGTSRLFLKGTAERSPDHVAGTTQASNWIMTELYERDVRCNGEEKMPPMPRIYLYPELRASFHLPPKTVASLKQTIQKMYRSARYQIFWARRTTLPAFRYSTPSIVHHQRARRAAYD
jgi:hypothetical protein